MPRGKLLRKVLVPFSLLVAGSDDVDEILDTWRTYSCPPTVSPRSFNDSDSKLRQETSGLILKLSRPWRAVVQAFEEGVVQRYDAHWAVTALELTRGLVCGARFRGAFPDDDRWKDYWHTHCGRLIELLRMAAERCAQLQEASCLGLWSVVESECLDNSCGWGCPDMVAEAVASLVPGGGVEPWRSQFFVPTEPLVLQSPVCDTLEEGPGPRWGSHSPARGHSLSPLRAEGGHAIWNRALSWEAILHMMFARGVPLSRTVLNLGAGDGDCSDSGGVWVDPANCLMRRGWWGLAFEADGVLAEAMAALDLPGVDVYDGVRGPARVVEAAREAGLATNLDLLKIDVDNGDCFFLEALLEAGYTPLLIHMEVLLGSVPPPFAVSQRYSAHKQLGDEGENAFAHHHRGCSLAAMASIAKDYFLVQVTHPPSDALWARRDVLAGVLPGATGLSLFDQWRLNFHCLPTRPIDIPGERSEWSSMPRADARVWADGRLPVDVRFGLVRDYFERYSRGEVGSAEFDMPAGEDFDIWTAPD